MSTATEERRGTVGRVPGSPQRLSRVEWISALKRSFSAFMSDDCMGLAQQIAYSSLLAFFPAMNLPRERKLELVGRVLDVLSARFAVCTMEAHAEAAARTPHLPVREPRLTRPAQTRWASSRATTA